MLFHNIYVCSQLENLLNIQSIILISMKAWLSSEQNEFPQVCLQGVLFSLEALSYWVDAEIPLFQSFISESLETLSEFSGTVFLPVLFEYTVKAYSDFLCMHQVTFNVCHQVTF